jgi:hypothetical protein
MEKMEARQPEERQPAKKSPRAIHPALSIGALGVLILSFILPPSGVFFISVCTFKNITGTPCPGCGLTRSVINISHMHIAQALHVNPMGIPIYLVLLFLAIYNFLPAGIRLKADSLLQRNERAVFLLGAFFVSGMLGVWIFRLIVVYGLHQPLLDRL